MLVQTVSQRANNRVYLLGGDIFSSSLSTVVILLFLEDIVELLERRDSSVDAVILL